MVLFSTSAETTNLSFSTSLILAEGVSQKVYDKLSFNIDYPFPSNFTNEHAHVTTIVLPEGEYYLLPRSGNPFFVVTAAPVYKFRVVNARITYIGNFHLSGGNLLAWSEMKYQRDVDYFVQKNPAMANTRIDRQEVELTSNIGQFEGKGIIFGTP